MDSEESLMEDSDVQIAGTGEHLTKSYTRESEDEKPSDKNVSKVNTVTERAEDCSDHYGL